MRLGLGLGVDSITSQKVGGAGFTGILDTVPDAFVAYSLDRISSAHTGGSVRVMRSSDTTEQDVTHNADGTINETDLLNFVNADVNQYTSDFSSTEDLNESNGTGAAAQSVGGVDDAYKFTLSGGSATHFPEKVSLFQTNALSYSISFDYYIPSGNASCDGIKLNFITGAPNLTTQNSWTSVELTDVQSSTSGLRFYASDGGSISVNGDGDVFYLKNIVVTQTTADGYISKIYDQSGNGRTQEQSDNAKQFRIVIGGDVQKENGKVVIRGDGNNDHVSLPAEVTAAHPVSFFWAYKHNTEQINNYIIGGQLFGSTGNRILVQDAAAQEFVRTTIDGSSRTIFNNGTDIIGEVRTFSSVSKSTGLNIRMDKAVWGSASANTSDLGFKSIGINSSNSNMVVWRELIIYAGDNGDQTDNVETIENDIYARTGRL
jgi:hypothetical protein